MTDAIPPALTPEEWKALRFGGAPRMPWGAIEDDGTVHLGYASDTEDGSEFRFETKDPVQIVKAIALLNAALPYGDLRRLHHGEVWNLELDKTLQDPAMLARTIAKLWAFLSQET